jgi:chemotaxis protein CheZ
VSDHVQENGDSPELEALFDTLSHKQAAQAAAPAAPVMPPPVGVGDGSGDSAELEALFESVARTAALETPPVTVKPFGDNGDSDELQALFDSLAAAAPEPEVENTKFRKKGAKTWEAKNKCGKQH